jgi:hypothetical protein
VSSSNIEAFKADLDHARILIRELTARLERKELELSRYKKVITDLQRVTTRNVEEEIEFVTNYVMEFIKGESKVKT